MLIDRYLQFETIVLFLLIIAFFTRVFPNNYGFIIILLVFAYIISKEYLQLNLTNINNFNNETKVKLNDLYETVYKLADKKEREIQGFNKREWITRMLPKELYIDATLIHFLHSIKILNDYSDINFVELLFNTNKILKLRFMIESFKPKIPENIFEIYNTSILLKKDAINTIHNFIYSIPKTNKMYNYVNRITERYTLLINRNLDIIKFSRDTYIKQNGVNVNTRFDNHNFTKGHDELDKMNFY